MVSSKVREIVRFLRLLEVVVRPKPKARGWLFFLLLRETENYACSIQTRGVRHHVLFGSLSKPRPRRQRERHQTKGLMSRTMAVHVRHISPCISLPSSVKQEREMTKFCVAWLRVTFHISIRNWTLPLNISPEYVFRAIGILKRSRWLRISSVKYSSLFSRRCSTFPWSLENFSFSSLFYKYNLLFRKMISVSAFLRVTKLTKSRQSRLSFNL